MDREAVQSSNLKSVGHSDVDNILEIEFYDGSVYQYDGVSVETHAELLNAPSKGKYLNSSIKGKYICREMK